MEPPTLPDSITPQSRWQSATPTQKLIFYIGVPTILIMVILYIYASYAAKQNFNRVTAEAEKAQKEVELLQERREASSTIDNWQTYHNKEFGFEFKYPEGWIQGDEKTNGQLNINLISPELRKRIEDNYKNCDEDRTNDVGTGGCVPEQRPAEIYLEIMTSNRQVDNPYIGEYMIGDTLWRILDDSGLYFREVYTTIQRDKLFKVYPVIGTNRDIFLKILSTFKFIDSVDMSTWKSYTKGTSSFGLGYRINYPKDWDLSTTESSLVLENNEGAMFIINSPPLGFGIDMINDIEHVIIDGEEAVMKKFDGGNNRDRIEVSFKNKSLENIQIQFNAPRGYDTNIFEDILSTFEFSY